MKLEYNDITKEQWEIYRAVEKACWKEDLKYILLEDYWKDINDFTDEEINAVLEIYDDYHSDSREWCEDMHFAINRILNI